MSERELVGTVQVDSGEIAIVDPSLILQMEDFLKVSTGLAKEHSRFILKKMMPKVVMESHELLLN